LRIIDIQEVYDKHIQYDHHEEEHTWFNHLFLMQSKIFIFINFKKNYLLLPIFKNFLKYFSQERIIPQEKELLLV
jgi:hypothetical protein